MRAMISSWGCSSRWGCPLAVSSPALRSNLFLLWGRRLTQSFENSLLLPAIRRNTTVHKLHARHSLLQSGCHSDLRPLLAAGTLGMSCWNRFQGENLFQILGARTLGMGIHGRGMCLWYPLFVIWMP